MRAFSIAVSTLVFAGLTVNPASARGMASAGHGARGSGSHFGFSRSMLNVHFSRSMLNVHTGRPILRRFYLQNAYHQGNFGRSGRYADYGRYGGNGRYADYGHYGYGYGGGGVYYGAQGSGGPDAPYTGSAFYYPPATHKVKDKAKPLSEELNKKSSDQNTTSSRKNVVRDAQLPRVIYGIQPEWGDGTRTPHIIYNSYQ